MWLDQQLRRDLTTCLNLGLNQLQSGERERDCESVRERERERRGRIKQMFDR